MPGSSTSIIGMALGSGIIVGGVLIALVLCSVGCWGVIVFKFIVLRRATKESKEFLKVFWDSSNFQTVESRTSQLTQSPVAVIFRAGYGEWGRSRSGGGRAKGASDDLAIMSGGIESVERSLRQAAESETARLQKSLIFLATVASAAPFVGLFGTVWGIMEAFRNIGTVGSASLAVVAPGISEALIATATGLAAAIPAVVAYNYFNNSIRVLSTEMEEFVTEFLNIVSRSSRKVGE
jgi:biopolymer transport protein TolQ